MLFIIDSSVSKCCKQGNIKKYIIPHLSKLSNQKAQFVPRENKFNCGEHEIELFMRTTRGKLSEMFFPKLFLKRIIKNFKDTKNGREIALRYSFHIII